MAMLPSLLERVRLTGARAELSADRPSGAAMAAGGAITALFLLLFVVA